MRTNSNLSVIAAVLFILTDSPASAVTYHVDSRNGSDTADGQSVQTPWQSLDQVNRADISPGDKVLFARGGLWRGTLKPHSGTPEKPVCYGAYGTGEMPKLYGSVDASAPSDWVEVQPAIWATNEIKPAIGAAFEAADHHWSRHQEHGAVAELAHAGNGCVLKVSQGGTASNHLQVWGPTVKTPLPDGLRIAYRARCSKPFAMPQLTIRNSASPWNPWFSAEHQAKLTSDWQTFEIFLSRQDAAGQPGGGIGRYHLALGMLPSDCVFEFELLDALAATIDRAKLLFCDVGNIIFDHGNFKKYHRCGIKRWSLDDCKNPGDYWYDAVTRRVLLRWPNNPAADCKSIELALRAPIVDEGGCHDVVFENLAVAYGAAHGFGGGNTARLTIRHCDVYYIGGGHQFTGPDGHPVRFGNGIEFWGSCRDNLVEQNRLWEIYDAALTNQGKGSGPDNPSTQVNITYRKNTIWNSEYSFEYWNRDATQITDRILFEDNLCVNAGHGWAHGQRPDPNGAHLMFYHNAAKTTRFVVRNNVFCEATEVCLRMENDWRSGLVLDGNRWFQAEQPLVRWLVGKFFRKHEWQRLQDELGMERNGTIGPLTAVESKLIPGL